MSALDGTPLEGTIRCPPETPKQWVCAGCSGCGCFWIIVTLITILANIKTLGPDEQAVVHNLDGDVVVNGPTTTVLNPFRDKTYRKASRLEVNQYVAVYNVLTCLKRHLSGPQLFFPEAYDEVLGVMEKVVLTKDEYVKFTDQATGVERVITGPATVMPGPNEVSLQGTVRANFINRDTAVLVRDKASGRQRLVTEPGVFFPSSYEEILEERPLQRVMTHEVVIVRNPQGQFTIYSGAAANGTGTAFFLQPFHEIVSMTWSTYRQPPLGDGDQLPVYAEVTTVDTREQKIFFAYHVRTSDNVKLRLDGTIFWRVLDVATMIAQTPDPEGDIWHHSRSALIQAVSRSTLAQFMTNFNSIVMDAFNAQASDGFYAQRGVTVISMELTGYEPTDASTRTVLQAIIQESTNRINRMAQQESENEVAAARLQADIALERQNTNLIRQRASNERLMARTEGEASGMRLAKDADAFFQTLSAAMPDSSTRLELYKMHKRLTAQNANTESLANGQATLFLTPDDMNVRLHLGGTGTSGSSNGGSEPRQLSVTGS